MRLLLVDGHPRVPDALAQRLQKAPRIDSVVVASTLEAALQMAEEHAPHVVLYDPRTVVGDAVEAVRLLRQAGRRVVVLTSSLLEHETAALRQAGAAAFLLKGVETSALLVLLDAVIAD